jgi:aspartate aminotransferase
VFTHAELTEIGEFAQCRNVWVICDEIYETMVYDGRRHHSLASLSPDMRSRTVVVNALSKTYAMTGWRVGYCAAPATLISAMLLILQQSSRGPATFVQDAAVAALTGPQDEVEHMRRVYAERRGQVLSALAGLPYARVLTPEGGFFVMVDVRSANVPSNQLRQRLLRDHGVAVMHGSAYGPGGEGTIRVSFASGGQTLVDGLGRLRKGLSGL